MHFTKWLLLGAITIPLFIIFIYFGVSEYILHYIEEDLNQFLNILIPAFATIFSVFLGLPLFSAQTVYSKWGSVSVEKLFGKKTKFLIIFGTVLIILLLILRSVELNNQVVDEVKLLCLITTSAHISGLSYNFFKVKERINPSKWIKDYFEEVKNNPKKKDEWQKLFNITKQAVSLGERKIYDEGIKKLYRLYNEKEEPIIVEYTERNIEKLIRLAGTEPGRESVLSTFAKILTGNEPDGVEEIEKRLDFYSRGLKDFSYSNVEYLSRYLQNYRKFSHKFGYTDQVVSFLIDDFSDEDATGMALYTEVMTGILNQEEINDEGVEKFCEWLKSLKIKEIDLDKEKSSRLKKSLLKVRGFLNENELFHRSVIVQKNLKDYFLETNEVDRKTFRTSVLYLIEGTYSAIKTFRSKKDSSKLEKCQKLMKYTTDYANEFLERIIEHGKYFNPELEELKSHFYLLKNLLSHYRIGKISLAQDTFNGNYYELDKDKKELIDKKVKIVNYERKRIFKYIDNILQLIYHKIETKELNKDFLGFVFENISEHHDELVQNPHGRYHWFEREIIKPDGRVRTIPSFNRSKLFLIFYLRKYRQSEKLEDIIPSPNLTLIDFFNQAYEFLSESNLNDALKGLSLPPVEEEEKEDLIEIVSERKEKCQGLKIEEVREKDLSGELIEDFKKKTKKEWQKNRLVIEIIDSYGGEYEDQSDNWSKESKPIKYLIHGSRANFIENPPISPIYNLERSIGESFAVYENIEIINSLARNFKEINIENTSETVTEMLNPVIFYNNEERSKLRDQSNYLPNWKLNEEKKNRIFQDLDLPRKRFIGILENDEKIAPVYTLQGFEDSFLFDASKIKITQNKPIENDLSDYSKTKLILIDIKDFSDEELEEKVDKTDKSKSELKKKVKIKLLERIEVIFGDELRKINI